MKKLLFLIALSLSGQLFGQKKYTSFAPITYDGLHDTIISGAMFSNPSGYCLYLIRCHNVTIIDCLFGPAKGVGVFIELSSNITVKRCYMYSVSSGVYALTSTGIKIDSNQIKNVLGPGPRGQGVQGDKLYGAGNSISGNRIENLPGVSFPEDAINVYKCNGTAASPIKISGNWIRGGGPSTSGGGIMTGDYGGSYIIVKDNILVDPGQYGIAIAGGNNIQLINNTIYAKQNPFTNVALYVWNQSKAIPCNNNTVSGNKVNWTNKDGVKAPIWNSENCGPVSGWSANTWNDTFGSAILPKIIITSY